MKFDPATPPEGTVRDWLDARATAGGVAVVFPETGDAIGWRELRDLARTTAVSLLGQGINKGESVAIMHPNGRDALICLYGALYGGFRATMINLAAGPEAIAFALDHSEAGVAFVHPDQHSNFAKLSLSRTITPVTPAARPNGADAGLPAVDPGDHALLMYTSGTTGRPKGVVHTQASLLAGGWTTAVAHGLGPDDRGFCVLPICHINGLCVSVMGSLVSGGSLTMVPKFSASKFWDYADQGACTWFSVVPTIISHLLHGDTEPTAVCRARLRFGRSASSALAVETQAAFETRFGVPIVETMGLTETAAQILSNPMPPARRKIGSPGTAYGCDVAIQGSDGTTQPNGIEGEIVVRGPNVMLEYLKNSSATEAAFRDGWLRTGDLGRMDADGFVFVTGRLKELIIKGGENIAPREIDEALYAHPDVVEAAAFARPCNSYGERVEAAVALREGAALVSDELVSFCAERLGAFKSPDIVHFLEELPKGPSGKIQRLKLAELIPN